LKAEQCAIWYVDVSCSMRDVVRKQRELQSWRDIKASTSPSHRLNQTAII
jgi:hypothetical protein